MHSSALAVVLTHMGFVFERLVCGLELIKRVLVRRRYCSRRCQTPTCTAHGQDSLPDWLKILILWQDAVTQIVRPFEVPQRDHGVWDSGTSFHELEDTVALQSVLSEYNALLAPDILHRVLIAVKSKHPDMSGIANIDDKVISKRAKLAQHLANDEPEDLLVRHVVCEYCHRGHRASSYLDLWR